VAAALDPTSWQDITNLTRVLVFCGCLHRSSSMLDMEDRLCRFLFSDYDGHVVKSRPTASSVASLAAAVVEINGSVSSYLFAEACNFTGKPLMRREVHKVQNSAASPTYQHSFQPYSAR
jgi:hypothetical protein